MVAHRKWDRAEVVPIICAKLAKGCTPLNVILAEFDPPIHKDTLLLWRKEDAAIGRDIDVAFETGSDRMAMQWLATAEGKTPSEGGRSTGNIKRDKLVCNALERLGGKWDLRYRPTMAIANDPNHPVTDPKRKATGLTNEQLIEIAAQGLKGLAEAGQKAAGTDNPDA